MPIDAAAPDPDSLFAILAFRLRYRIDTCVGLKRERPSPPIHQQSRLQTRPSTLILRDCNGTTDYPKTATYRFKIG
ncbi:hypothetical protein [Geobacter benzoatilyticus]|uniref:Uncharacterized protein n=1 Tax=Geobacter benzoatilyticus TaxID=2815309 RepID=A0ABX7Q3L8_9BACT|nr:hypothetical protein [Geobacter benzoatilyticus]QSV46046.1 hypothetical protein JZM60_01765 [Geobacter benzoatilyticus]